MIPAIVSGLAFGLFVNAMILSIISMVEGGPLDRDAATAVFAGLLVAAIAVVWKIVEEGMNP